MKKILSIILTVFMMFSIGGTVVACKEGKGDNISQTQEKTDDEKIRLSVIKQGLMEGLGKSIGGNSIQFAMPTITCMSSIIENRCYVSGVMKMTDIYGTV